jgi:hypothetical protein
MISVHGTDTITYAWAGIYWWIVKTPEIWLPSFNEIVRLANRSRGIEFGGGGTEDMEAV